MSKETSKDVAAVAAKLMEHPDSDVRRVAASCLAQREVDDLKERAWTFYRPFFDRISDWGQSKAGRAALGIKLGACIMEAVCEHLEALPELQAEHERIVQDMQGQLDGTREDLRSALRVLLKRSPEDSWVRAHHPALYAEMAGDAEWSA